MIDHLRTEQTGAMYVDPAAPALRRLPPFWKWTLRVLWMSVFVVMVILNCAAIVVNFQRATNGDAGGAAGLRATPLATAAGEQSWTLVVDPTGPSSQAGILTGDRLLAVDGVEIPPNATYREVNGLLLGRIGDPMTLTVESNGGNAAVGAAREVTITFVSEDLLQIWRRFRVPLQIAGYYLPTLEALLLVVYLLTSLFIFWRRSDDWLAIYLTLTLVLITPQMSYVWHYLGQTAAHWEVTLRILIAVAVTLTLPNFYLLPNGIFVPRWTVVLTVLWVIFCVMTEFFPTSRFSIYGWSGEAQLLVWLGWFATGMLAQVYRFRYEATPTERQQIKWVSFGLTVVVVVNLGWTLAFELVPLLSHPGPSHIWMWLIGRTIYVIGMMTLPIAFGIAVFRYRLWDIDNLINRTLVYGTLTGVIIGIYVIVVTVLDVFFTIGGQFLSAIIAITLDLIIFEPLRDWLQRKVDRLMFGESDDLPTVVARLGERLSVAEGVDAVLPTIVQTLAESLNVPYVAIALPDGDHYHIVATTGIPNASYFTWPLVYHRQPVGQLIVAPRSLGQPLKPAEWQLVEHISYHVSASVHDILLEMELKRKKSVVGSALRSAQESAQPISQGVDRGQ